jgi:hypothetical protein
MTPAQQEIVRNARSMLGARWQHQARGLNRTDCLGLVLYAAQQQGIADVDIPDDYERNAAPDAMLKVCRQHLVEVTRADLQPGDVVVLRYPTTNHIGICGDYPVPGHVSLIHAQATHPHCVVENRLDDAWLKMVKAYVAGCFRFPELAQ